MRETLRHSRWLLMLVVGHLVFTALWSLAIPLGEAPDEADHWAYIVYLARERHLPRGPELTQSKHPPLYHAMAALIASAVVPNLGRLDSRLFLRANPDVSFRPEDVAAGTHGFNSFIHTTYEDWPWRPGPLAYHLARLWSVLLSTLTVWATYRLLRLTFPRHEAPALAATGMLAFLPEFAFIGGALNNDNVATLLGTLALWGGMAVYREGGKARPGWWTPLALGLGIWAKVSTAALWPAVLWLAFLAGRGRPLRERMGTVLFLFLPAVVIAAPWFLRNWWLYGEPMGWALVRQTVDVRQGPWTWADTRWLLRGWFLSFWGKFGSAGHIPMHGPAYLALAGISACAAGGWPLAWRRAAREGQRDVIPALALVLAILAVAGAMWRYSLVALGTDQARLLFPAIAPLVGAFAVGWLAWMPRTKWRAGAKIITAGSLALGVYALTGVLLPAYAPPASAPPQEWQALSRGKPVDFGEISLIAWDLQERPVLYWQAGETPSQDVRVVLRITAEDGTLVWEWKRSPGAGRWSTDHWPPGYVMRDRYRVRWPDWAGPGRYRIEVAAYAFPGTTILPTREGKPAATPEHPYVFLGWMERR